MQFVLACCSFDIVALRSIARKRVYAYAHIMTFLDPQGGHRSASLMHLLLEADSPENYVHDDRDRDYLPTGQIARLHGPKPPENSLLDHLPSGIATTTQRADEFLFRSLLASDRYKPSWRLPPLLWKGALSMSASSGFENSLESVDMG